MKRKKLQQIREKAIAEIEGSDGLDRLNEVRQAVLGKRGELTAVLKGMKDVAPEDRPKVGQWVNDTRTAIETIMEEKMKNWRLRRSGRDMRRRRSTSQCRQ